MTDYAYLLWRITEEKDEILMGVYKSEETAQQNLKKEKKSYKDFCKDTGMPMYRFKIEKMELR